MIILADVVEYYQYFYSKRFESEKYKFKPSEKGLKSIATFLNLMKVHYPTMGRRFLWRYFIFQFLYWEDLTLEAFYGKFRIELVVGQKAFKRWQERNKDFDGQIDSNDLKANYGIRMQDLISNIESVPIHYPAEEGVKLAYHNTEKGFVTCIAFTTLFDSDQEACRQCKFNKDCKNILKQNYPHLYEIRGYRKS
jgi:hypothetical protein